MGTPPNERAKAYRQRKRVSGLVRLSFFMTAEAQAALWKLRAQHPDSTTDAILNGLLLGEIPLSGHSECPLPGHSKPLPDNRVEPLSGHRPQSRAELATIGHQWRKEGQSATAIACGFNAEGWTPDTIPKERGVKPRTDSATAWTVKSVSQLLSRDYPEA
jgi:hypothetical protein